MLNKSKKISKHKKQVTSEPKAKRVHLFLAFFYAVQASLLTLFASTRQYSLVTNYLVKDPLISTNNNTVLVSATKTVVDVSLANVLLAILLFAVFYHLFLATLLKKRSAVQIKAGVNKYHWLDVAISNSLIVFALCLMFGIFDLVAILMLIALSIVFACAGVITEDTKATQKVLNRQAFFLGWGSWLVSWLVFAISIWNSLVIGGSQFSLYTYLSALVVLLSGCILLLGLYYSVVRQGKWANYNFVTKRYLVLSVATKVLLVWLVFASLS